MKNYYIAISLLISAIVVSCTDSVEKYDNWPEWKTQDPVTVAGEEMTETYYTNYVGKKTSVDTGCRSRFHRIRGAGVCLAASILGV